MRDFHIAHYRLMQKDTCPFWQDYHCMTLPDSLQYRLTLFLSRGRIAAYENDLISDQHWTAFLLGLNLWPERYDPVADTLSEEYFIDLHQKVRTTIANTVSKMPYHQEFIDRYCAANQ
jgi:tryptophan halogenase